jgi:hypothetical protein
MLSVRVSGGPGKEVPPEESKNEPQEKRTVRSAGMPERYAETLLRKNGTRSACR